MDSIKCICCNKTIKRLGIGKYDPAEKPQQDNWCNGDVNRFYLGYGSRHDDNTYLVAICDDCIQDRFDKGVIIDITNR